MSSQDSSSYWEDLKSELFFLKSTYFQPGECNIISPPSLDFTCLDMHPPCHPVSVLLRLTMEGGCVDVQLQINKGYPQFYPSITLLSPTTSPSFLAALQDSTNALARSLCPEPSIFQLTDHIVQSCAEQTYTTHNPSLATPMSSCSSSTCSSGHTTTETHTTIAHSTRDTTKDTHTTLPYLLESSQNLSFVEQQELGENNERKALSVVSESSVGSVSGHEVWVVALDHMRSQKRYTQALDQWSRELGIGGWVLVVGRRNIFVVLVGERKGMGEMVSRWRREEVDVDRCGRPCKERMMRVLSQHSRPPPPIHK